MTGGSAGNFFTLHIKPVAENLGLVRLAAAAFAGQLDFTLTEIEELKIAVNEAVTNAIVHAYPRTGGKESPEPPAVTVEGWTRNGAFFVKVADTGVGIDDVNRAREPAFSTDPERMGMGFVFMEAFMDRVDVESSPGGGTAVTMSKIPSHSLSAGQRVM